MVQRRQFARLAVIFQAVIHESLADEEARHQRRQQHGHNVGGAQRNGHGNRQRADEFAHGARQQQQRNKRRDDGQRRGQHRNRHLRRAPLRGLVQRHLAVQQFHVVVHNHDGVVHHHPQHHNQR